MIKVKSFSVALAALVISVLPAIGLARAPAAPAHQAANPQPPMWVIRDDDSTLYLFGSIHAMRDGVTWLTPAVQESFEASDELWLEVEGLDDTARMMQVARAYAVDPANSMTQGLTAEEIADLDRRLPPCGRTTRDLMGTRKWAVGLFLVQCQFNALGLESDNGIDMTLLRRARAAGMPVHGLETIEDQLKVLTGGSEADETETLRATLRELDETPEMIDKLINAWLAGDVKTLDHYLVARVADDDPKGYQRFIVVRNKAWVPRIEAILAGKGTTFMAVGTAHLVGPDSVIALLRKQGIKAQAINTASPAQN